MCALWKAENTDKQKNTNVFTCAIYLWASPYCPDIAMNCISRGTVRYSHLPRFSTAPTIDVYEQVTVKTHESIHGATTSSRLSCHYLGVSHKEPLSPVWCHHPMTLLQNFNEWMNIYVSFLPFRWEGTVQSLCLNFLSIISKNMSLPCSF